MINKLNNKRSTHTLFATGDIRPSVTQTFMYCTMLSLLATTPAMAETSYPGASNGQNGTVVNTAPSTDAVKGDNTPSFDIFGSLFGSDDKAPNNSANTTNTTNTANNVPSVAEKDLGAPDSSPALFAARTELDIQDEGDNSPALFATRTELDIEPTSTIIHAVDKVVQDPKAAPASISRADASGMDMQGQPDNSPALFASRTELEPTKDSTKVANVLSSFMKPVDTPAEAKSDATDKKAVVKAVAAYQSPGIVVKKAHHEQATYQPEIKKEGVKLAGLVPASGTTQTDNGPLIKLPDMNTAMQPPKAIAIPAKPVSAAKIDVKPTESKVASEPRRELSPASKAILRKIPANIDAPAKKTAGPIAVDRSKKVSSNAVVSANSVTHEEMGIKIEVKEPTLDLSYELEKAYNATIAGQTSIAMDIYKNVLSNDPKNKGALFGLGTLYHRAGQIDAARKFYSKLLMIEPSNRDALNNFLVLMADEAPEAALEQLSKLEKRDPKFSPIPAQMAIIYQKMGDMDRASQKMFRAVDLSPENLVYRYNLAIMLDKQSKYDEAGKLYYQIVQAYQRGQEIPGNIQKIQQRLTFISSNTR